MIDLHELANVRVAAQLFPIRHHLGRKISADAGKSVKSRRIRNIDIDKGYVNVFSNLRNKVSDTT